jgi:hypothetical protein
VALIKFQAPQPDELGFAKSLEVMEIGGTNCLVLQQEAALGAISTLVLRGSTEGFLDDVERAVDDGVNAYKVGWGGVRLRGGGGGGGGTGGEGRGGYYVEEGGGGEGRGAVGCGGGDQVTGNPR